MKRIQFLLSGLIACVVAFSLTTQASAQSAQDGTAKVVGIKGIARYKTATDPNWLPLKVGMVLKQGTTIQTGNEDSHVDLVFNNLQATRSFGAAPIASGAPSPVSTAGGYTPQARQDAVRIQENSLLTLDTLTVTRTGMDTVTDTELNLQAGNLFGTVKKLSPASKYEIKLPNGVAGVRGTIYAISANGNVTVISGEVVISYVVNGVVQTFDVHQHEQFQINAQGQPEVVTLTDEQYSDMLQNLPTIRVAVPGGPKERLTIPDENTVVYVSPTR